MPLRLFRRGSVWYLRGSVAGQRLYQSTRVDDRAAAEAIRIRTEAKLLQRAAYGRRATATFAEAALTYLESGGEARFLGPVLRHFGPDKLLKDITNEAVNACAEAVYQDTAPATINRQIIGPIAAIMHMAADDDLCDWRRFKRRKVAGARLRWLIPAEADLLIGAADARTAAIIAFLLGTGCRTGEALFLQVKHLHVETREAWIAEAKNGHPRMVGFPARTARALAAFGIPDAGVVFRTPKNRPYAKRTNGGGQIQHAFNKARDAAGLGSDVTPHTLRHTWATWFYAQTRDFGGLMDRGGWRKAEMANRYRKISPADLGEHLLAHGWDFTGAGLPAIRRGVETAARAAQLTPLTNSGLNGY